MSAAEKTKVMDRFTPSPKPKRHSMGTARRRDRSESLMSSDSTGLERPIRRLQLLRRLALDMDEEERNAEKLFRTFDLSIDDSTLSNSRNSSCSVRGDDLVNGMASLFCEGPLVDATRSLSPGSDVEYSARLATPPASNSYLSTPMRMKYFPTLSPTILKMLLRTPSDYSPSARSTSDSSATSPDVALPLRLLSRKTSCSNDKEEDPFWSFDESPGSMKSNAPSTLDTGMPLTPPPSARLPGSDRFSMTTSERMRETDMNRIIDDSQYDIISSAPTVTLTAASSPRLGTFSVLNHERTVQYPLLSPLTLRHFLYVIEELKSLHGDHGERQQILKPNVRVSISAPAALGVSPATSSRKRFSPRRPRSPLIAPDLQHESALNQEFAALLLAQAIEEEEQAAELRRIADRLEGVALTRRRLAGVTIAKTAGMDNQLKREQPPYLLSGRFRFGRSKIRNP
ncbi:hypothetical protein NEOLEDRAFT_182345 [Neolentinus lepideus HHB14362 ss-1]|uniref:Uncharacterized protein n=1 Tax=Neolentinus lepideus HHB14362 ss-1 TaxID=1314782 RepID=A0A165TNN9_9AGAM|nr:hypothetical protein NEOLEDRAFT_182345 [Neolentinus lepideus HHB14362 ss-1]